MSNGFELTETEDFEDDGVVPGAVAFVVYTGLRLG